MDLAKTYASAENGVVGQYTPEPEMDWFEAPEYWLSRFVFERALGVVYLVATLIADVLYSLLNPRIRLSSES